MRSTTLTLTSTSRAVTYSFRGDRFGWACCTVSEATGELSITSDWGNWSHRWNTRHLGDPSLHAFIGRGSVDYLAGKLIPGSCYVFDANATTARLRELIIEARREGRIEKEAARTYWEELGDLACNCSDSADLYLSGFNDTEMRSEMQIWEPWNYARERHSNDYEALTKIILPALCAVCKTEASKYGTTKECAVCSGTAEENIVAG